MMLTKDWEGLTCGVDASTLPLWRYKLRERLIPIVRWETPYLASLQAQLRTPVLDQYFAFRYTVALHAASFTIETDRTRTPAPISALTHYS